MHKLGIVLLAIATGWAFGICVAALTDIGSFTQPHVIAAALWMAGPGSWLIRRYAKSRQQQAAERPATAPDPTTTPGWGALR
jgi:hypothetical protein